MQPGMNIMGAVASLHSNLAEAQLKFKTGVALLRLEYQRVLDAIHSDSK